ncbi:LCP family protein required for cell wall assembly [Streptomyces pseudovenezuelae]|uniref:LCP family protein required for cell wall assembly n=2 Tax=Streptomyces pseudovenezuelae TaxID=67350 RepID=A0ABT6LWF2_9ACTN|nr:LCP family protein required for cell wall assembly [Streptomyces pseudovenezuelae]
MTQNSVRAKVPAVEDTMSLTPQAGGRRGRGPRGDRKRRGRRILRWTATVTALVTVGTAGAGYLYYRHLNANIEKDALNIGDSKDRAAESKANAAGQTPLNILLIGSDARDSAENQKLGGAKDTYNTAPRADVQMLLHVSADRTNMSVVSMPRDTLVDIPECTDPDTGKVYPASTSAMTNTTLERGGPGCAVATWEKLTDIHIDHFMMVDFSGVVSMADAIGGVPVCVDANIYSHTSSGHGSGLKLEKGTTSIKGEQALQWLRTRYGFEDGSDIARTKAQHMYMNSMVRRLRANTTLSNPGKLRKLAETATKALTVDDGLGTVAKLYDVSTELKKVPTARITMTTMPWVYSADGNRVLPKATDAEKLWRLVREDIALDGKDKKKTSTATRTTDKAAADDEIAVTVQNGTRSDGESAVTGRAGAVAQLLVGKGFDKAVADSSALLSQAETVVRYPSADLQADAQRVAKSLGIPVSSVKRSTAVSGVTLVVGVDWRSGAKYTAEDDTTPASASALNGADSKACMHVDPDYTWS